jgi:hypothetical protein
VPHPVVPHLPFPFPGDRFPSNLGAVVQRTVVDGKEPARQVVHDADGSWLVGDGLNDPNVQGACTVIALVQLTVRDPSLGKLATLEPGHLAWRSSTDLPWQIEPHSYPEE